ncbi:MAG: opacity protein-like surface antigen [Saprospiraceae bacterium]|jgi:opacity protein-like surface antigen
MKKNILFSFVLILGLATQTQAQNDDYRMNAGISVNYTFTGDVINTAVDIAESSTTGFDQKGVPSLQFTFDYGLTKWFSLGIAASYQNIGYDFTGNSFIDSLNNEVIEDYSIDFSRTTVALRPLFHYANNDKLDLYSGLRIQYFSRNFENTSQDPETEVTFEDLADDSKIGVGIVAFGARYYITDNIGLGTEINIGRPYFLNLSVNARF